MEYTELKDAKNIVSKIKENQPDVKTVFFVGCGGSMSDHHAANYFLQQNAKKLNSRLLNANEFNYAKPANVDEHSVTIVASLGGNTPESIHAVSKAKEWGSQVIAVTHDENSDLTEDSDFIVKHNFFESYADKAAKQKSILMIAVELLNQFEGYKYYDEMIDGFNKIDDITNDAADSVLDSAKEFGEEYKNEETIHTLASGPNLGTGYSTATFIFMEMQWISSPFFDTAEYFHGPFELTNKDTPYLLFMSDGATRPLDTRALTFLQRIGAKYTVLDANDFELGFKLDKHVSDYFNPILLTGVMRVYLEQLAAARKHPVMKRQYMWKLEDY